jgi:hypothetical protein
MATSRIAAVTAFDSTVARSTSKPISVVMDVSDLAVAPLEPHYVARLRIGAVFEDRDHFPTLEPARGEQDVIDLGVQCEEQADVRTADAKRVQRLMELDVVGQQRP